MVSLCTNFLEEMPNIAQLILWFLHLNRNEIPSAGEVIAKEKNNTITFRNQKGILHFKRDLLGYNQGKISEEYGIVNYSLCFGGNN